MRVRAGVLEHTPRDRQQPLLERRKLLDVVKRSLFRDGNRNGGPQAAVL